MGLIRKAASLSTGGGVKYTSRREAETKAAAAAARASREEAKLLKAQRKAIARGAPVAPAAAPAPATEPAAPAAPPADLPWYKQPTLGKAIAAGARQHASKQQPPTE